MAFLSRDSLSGTKRSLCRRGQPLHCPGTTRQEAKKFQCVASCIGAVVMQYTAVSCSVMQCHAVLCSVMQCHAVLCSVMQCYAVSCSVMQCPVVLWSIMQCYAGSCSAIHLQDRAVLFTVMQSYPLCVEGDSFRWSVRYLGPFRSPQVSHRTFTMLRILLVLQTT